MNENKRNLDDEIHYKIHKEICKDFNLEDQGLHTLLFPNNESWCFKKNKYPYRNPYYQYIFWINPIVEHLYLIPQIKETLDKLFDNKHSYCYFQNKLNKRSVFSIKHLHVWSTEKCRLFQI